MVAGLLCALVLAGILFVLRVGASNALCVELEPSRPERAAWWGLAVSLLGAAPLSLLLSSALSSPQAFSGDMTSHARVAAELARTGLPNGWVDSYLGGFPIGHHYPTLGWLLLAGGIRAGVSPAVAVNVLGFSAALALILVTYAGLLRLGVRARFACLGACVLSWVSPYNSFVGGFETFFSTGLVSQVLAMPINAWLVVAALRSQSRWEVPLCAWLAMASHPQITAATVVVLCASALVAGQRATMCRALWAASFAVLAGAALYGQGITTLDIPFGWPADMGWRQLGFPPQRLSWWLLDGDLLDAGRLPVTTALLAAAFLILLACSRQRAARAVAFALVFGLALSVSGRALLSLGAMGSLLLSFLQPLRVVSLIPVLAAAGIALALQLGSRALHAGLSAVGRPRLSSAVGWAVAVLAFGIAALGVPARLASVRIIDAEHAGPVFCTGFERETVRSWLSSLDGGKLWYEAHDEAGLFQCLNRDGTELASSVPIGTAPAVGAHVGVLARAAQFLEPDRAGSAARAEALGIGYVLTNGAARPVPEGWRVRHRNGSIQLLERPASVVGAGCITRLWTGSPEDLRQRLNADLARAVAADRVLDPLRWTAIRYTTGEVVETPWPDGCDSSKAQVSQVAAGSGRVLASVQSPAPVDVVLRVSAFPTWRVHLDEQLVPTTLVAPGFISVRVAPGAHRLRAEVGLLPFYPLILIAALLLTATLAVARGRGQWVRARLARLTRLLRR